MEYPEIVYRYVKFTGFEDNAEYTTLNNKTGQILVKLSSPTSFTDRDCAFKQREINLSEFENKVKTIASQCAIKVDYVAPELMQKLHQQEASILKNALSKLQILCCSTSNRERFNWRKFANEFRGISIGIRTKTFVKELDIGGRIVKYQKRLPKIDLSKNLKYPEMEEKLYEIICTKLNRFKKEKEFRFFTIERSRIIELTKRDIKEVIIGYAMDSSVRAKTIEFCQRYLPEATLYEAILENGIVKIKGLDSKKNVLQMFHIEQKRPKTAKHQHTN